MESNKIIDLQIQQLKSAKSDCVMGLFIDLLGLNGELMKCVLAAVSKKERYEKVSELYDKRWNAILKQCADEIEKAVSDAESKFSKLTDEEAEALSEAAKRTCEMDG